jgi:hypothetical protein
MEEKKPPLSDLSPEQAREDAGSTPLEPHRNGTYPNSSDEERFMEGALDWIRSNQGVALLGAFGLGVFLGVMIRR